MSSQIVAKRYAKALLELGQEDGNTDRYGADLDQMADLFAQSPELESALANPAFDLESRQNVLAAFLAKLELSPMAENFFKLLLDRGRMSSVRDIAQIYAGLLDQVKGIVRARVRSAASLSEGDISRLKDALKGVAGRDVQIEVEDDPSLIGGVVTKIGDLVLDGSVKSQLAALKDSLRRGEYA